MQRRRLETRRGRHVLTVVFVAFLVEAEGVPLPSRLLLLIAATAAIDARQVAALVVVGTAGSLIGDHVLYLAGAMTGPRILAFYCWITLGSPACVGETVGYFTRFGAAAVLPSRFSAQRPAVRLGAVRVWPHHLLEVRDVRSARHGRPCRGMGDSRIHCRRADRRAARPHRGARLLVLVGPVVLATLIVYRPVAAPALRRREGRRHSRGVLLRGGARPRPNADEQRRVNSAARLRDFGALWTIT